MIPDSQMGTPILLLYMAAYALAAAGILLPFLPRSNPTDSRTRAAGRFLQVLALTGIIPSLQVILGALGITENLPGDWPAVLNLIFNNLIIVGLWGSVITWSGMAAAFSPGVFIGDRFRRPLYIGAAAVTAVNLITQSAALIHPIPVLLRFAEIGLLIHLILLAVIALEAAARIYRPCSRAGNTAGDNLLKSIAPLFLLFALLASTLPPPFHRAAPPLALIVLFTLGIIIFIRRTARLRGFISSPGHPLRRCRNDAPGEGDRPAARRRPLLQGTLGETLHLPLHHPDPRHPHLREDGRAEQNRTVAEIGKLKTGIGVLSVDREIRTGI